MEKRKQQQDSIVLGFWAELPEYPVLLAPMADVTDWAFRRMIARYSRMGEEGGGPDVLYTEFVSADGLCSEEGREKLLPMLNYDREYRPIVAQIFSKVPEHMECAARLVRELGFDGVDINMGCPVEKVVRQGAGSAMIRTPELAQEIIAAAKRGAGGEIPVSVKTRIGWTRDEVDTWIPALLETDIAAIILHGRTRKEMSKVPAHWESIARAAEIVHASGKPTLLIGNGDVTSLEQARAYQDAYGVDGVMIGRGVFGKPWLFDREQRLAPKSVEEKLRIMIEHTYLFEELHPERNFALMKKHYKAYVNGFDGAKELRTRLMEEAENADAVARIVNEFLERNFL